VAGDGGGYVDLDGDGNWWVPSGRMFYVLSLSSPQQEKAQAVQHFFLGRRFENQFGNATTLDYDQPYDLFAAKTTDAVSNTVTVTNDYRVLQPALLMDANDNRTAVAFDALGMVAGTAVMGKTSESVGDSLTGFAADLMQAQID